ncbi:MAG: hypothetical protein HY858_12515 [Candidatus Solibacter usitatus]|nr:hypothetical protein [Candidatus Solibacter usitatus]
MKTRVSVALPEELLRRMDRIGKNRSALMQRAIGEYVTRIEYQKRAARDMGIINRNAARLNREAMDVLGYQSAS